MSNTIKLVYYSEIKSKKVDWLWFPYIAYGRITMIQGDPGDGKTTLALMLVAMLSNGKNTYNVDGLKITRPCNVIFQTAEDGVDDTIKPRLEIMNANCGRVAYLEDEKTLNLEDDSIEQLIVQSKAKLFILDPIQSFLARGKSMQSVSDIRPMMKNLSKIAKRTNCAIVLIGHLNKSEGTKDLYRGLGSIDITAIARSILYVKRSEEKPSIRIVNQIKNSIEKEGEPVAYELINGSIRWIGVYKDEPLELEEVDKLTQAKEFLINLLEDEMRTFNDISELAKKNNMKMRTITRAKKELAIISVRKENKWFWKL